MEDIKTLFGKKVKEFRIKRKYTQETLCEMLGISPQALSNIENGHTFPSYKILVLLSEILGVSVNYFFVKENDLKDIETQILISEFNKLNPAQRKNVLEIIKNINELSR